MQLAEFRERLRTLGAKPAHEERMLRAWLQARPLDSGTRRQTAENFLPLAIRDALPALTGQLAGLARVVSEHPGDDGTRLLVELADGQTVESVLLPRDGVCISTQIGCAVGCTFCMTGRDGLLRQVSSAEMLAQVVLARQRQPLRRVVFMGMGEPSHNLDNVLETIALLGTAGGFGHKNLVFSTVGDPRVFERLPQQRVVPALALSLHTTDGELRDRLLPKAPRMAPEELVELAEIYARQTGYPIQYQWTLLAGVNDSIEEMDGIVRLLAGKYAIMNLIPYNTTAALDFQRPANDRVTELAHYLHARGIRVTVRRSAGQDVDGGCGQLRARSRDGSPVAPPRRRSRPSADAVEMTGGK
ncbi:RNA methyltransferase [uncultured Azonexus sp.]|uniref:RNA methyltransferase n=1 Tax=uncultured Azonexus sp. TaxID=520307 RepID=UPI0026163254|nr:RNA methyltransferase [uncultured Azonexus sp.]